MDAGGREKCFNGIQKKRLKRLLWGFLWKSQAGLTYEMISAAVCAWRTLGLPGAARAPARLGCWDHNLHRWALTVACTGQPACPSLQISGQPRYKHWMPRMVCLYAVITVACSFIELQQVNEQLLPNSVIVHKGFTNLALLCYSPWSTSWS